MLPSSVSAGVKIHSEFLKPLLDVPLADTFFLLLLFKLLDRLDQLLETTCTTGFNARMDAAKSDKPCSVVAQVTPVYQISGRVVVGVGLKYST